MTTIRSTGPREVQLVLGGPGTGKTTHFIGRDDSHPGVIGDLLNKGIQPHEIAYVSFTRKAADEAATRTARRFGLERSALPYFRTIHSMAFRETGTRNDEIMQRSDYKQIAALLGVTFTGYIDPADGPVSPSREGDLALQWIGYAQARQIPLKQVWQQSGEAVEWKLVKLFADTVASYKADTGKKDFSDLLTQFTDSGWRAPVKAAIIDEAQDLSPAQWAAVRAAFRNVQTVYFGADDDQCIHSWAGADVEHLFRIRAERLVLPVSHRLPREVFTLATSIARRIRHRFEKDWRAADHSGAVQHMASIDDIDLTHGESWMLLARNSCYLADYERMCREQGVPYATTKGPSIEQEHIRAIVTWERLRNGKHASDEDTAHALSYAKGRQFADVPWHVGLTRIKETTVDYYQHCLRNGYRLQDVPTVHIGTIHSVKGGEAENVVLKTDMTYRTQQGMERDADNEHRVFYVGASRAKKNLFIIDPQERGGYEL